MSIWRFDPMTRCYQIIYPQPRLLHGGCLPVPAQLDHTGLVRMFLAAGWQERGFWKTLRAHLPKDDHADACWDGVPRIRPDVFLIFPRSRTLAVVEVDITHSPASSKWLWVWDNLDAEGWSLIELRCDKFGTISAPIDHWVEMYDRGKFDAAG